ncbi:CaiF/GrlA family transcriptional regulator [Serratia ureilytica]|uniref:CaiF/GrlA family transcriptional regulator n=1 Tax=Serratia ureilytica TaxID=300181 RepID=UPI0018D821CB|nr:CaiF/GrlA family transcriptional regulator [Serratia ureilytica]MBH2928744.1 CaiF/GrlA family transcriptional regulator [Serratia ureilytica]
MAETLTCNPKQQQHEYGAAVAAALPADTPRADRAHSESAGAAQVIPAGAEVLPRERTARQVVAGRQSNHGDWSLPAELAGSGIRSLWLAVAFWSLRQARPVTRDDIAQAFRISVRRAADVVSYLLTTRSDRVVSERKIHRVASGHRVATLRGVALVAGPVEDGPVVPPVRSRKPCAQEHDAKQQAATALARAKAQFLGRRSGPGAA